MSSPAIKPDFLQQPLWKWQTWLWGTPLIAIVIAPFLVWHSLSAQLFSADFLPHLYCYLSKPGLVWTHVSADSLIALSYLAISITLASLVYKASPDIPFHFMFVAFGLFILACGATHLVEVITVWKPVYVLAAALKVFTAAASLVTAIVLPFTVPRVLRLVANARASERATQELRAGEAHREQLLRELRERKEMFERFFDSAPDAILVTDKSGIITDTNEQTSRIFGYEREELIGHSIEMLIPEHLRKKHESHRDDYFAAPKMRPMGQGLDLYARRKDGSQYPVDITLSPLRAVGELRVLASVRDMTEYKLAEEKIRESLREKEVLLREVHHRVKNNLAVICSLFYLESTYAKDEHTAQVFRESESRVHSMALVHETLYGSKNLSRIDFSEYAKALATDILSSYGNSKGPVGSVQLKSDLEPVIMSIDLAVPCGLILNELISNAFKHGFANARDGEITVALLANSNGRCLLRVDDNGAGIPSDFDVNTKKSLGLRLVRSLTRQIRGSFELVRTEPGTSARVQFPVNQHAN